MVEQFLEGMVGMGSIAQLADRWLQAFMMDLARYLVGVGLVSILLMVVFRSYSAQRRIQARTATRADVTRELKHSLITIIVYATVAVFTIEAIDQGWTQLYAEVESFGITYLLLSIPILLALHDTYFYWVHRLMHQPLLFRKVHRIHHLSRTPTCWAAYSFSVWEALVMTLFVPLILFIFPIHPISLFVFLAVMIIRNAMGHSGIEFHPIGWVDSPCDIFTTVTHHDLHHQKLNGNYGLYFTWWDRLMGTELPEYKQAFRDAATPHGDSIHPAQPSILESK